MVSRDPNSNITLEQGIIPGESVTLFLEPGTVLNIDIDNARWPELQWQGGACNNDLMKLYAKTLPMKHEAFEYLRKTYVPGITEDEKAQANKQRALLNGKAQEELIRFVKGNPSSYAALYLLGNLRNVLELNDYVTTFNGFNPDLRATALGKEMNVFGSHASFSMAIRVLNGKNFIPRSIFKQYILILDQVIDADNRHSNSHRCKKIN